MYGHYPGAGPFMMAQPPQPQYVFIPVNNGGMGMPTPTPPSMPPRKPGKKAFSMKKLIKIRDEVNKMLKESEPKKDDKPKKLKDKTFTWLELWAMLMTWSLPVSILVLGGVKAFTVLVKSLA